MEQRLIRASTYPAMDLRHAPDELGLTLRPGGWVPADDLLAAAGRRGSSTVSTPLALQGLLAVGAPERIPVEAGDPSGFNGEAKARAGHGIDPGGAVADSTGPGQEGDR